MSWQQWHLPIDRQHRLEETIAQKQATIGRVYADRLILNKAAVQPEPAHVHLRFSMS
jgi:hypothetical protein